MGLNRWARACLPPPPYRHTRAHSDRTVTSVYDTAYMAMMRMAQITTGRHNHQFRTLLYARTLRDPGRCAKGVRRCGNRVRQETVGSSLALRKGDGACQGGTHVNMFLCNFEMHARRQHAHLVLHPEEADNGLLPSRGTLSP